MTFKKKVCINKRVIVKSFIFKCLTQDRFCYPPPPPTGTLKTNQNGLLLGWVVVFCFCFFINYIFV